MKLLKNLPDWMNPVFVKDLRQEASSLYLIIVSGIALLLEALFFLLAWHFMDEETFIPMPEQAVMPMQYVAQYLQFGIMHAVMLMVPVIARWLSERSSDAIAPDRITPLSAGTILRGKITVLFLVQLWSILIWLPFGAYLINKQATPEIKISCVLIVLLWLFGQFMFLVWSMLLPLTIKPQRDSSGGTKFLAAFLFILSSIVLHFILTTLCTPVRENGILIGELSVKGLIILFSMVILFTVYGILLIHSTTASKHANKMFPARFGGLILLLIASGILYFCNAGAGSIVFLFLVYLSMQFFLVCDDACIQPIRLRLDAPRNPLLKAIWYFCGTGMKWGWIYNSVLFATAIAILHFSGDDYWLGRILIADCAYYALYAAITCWLVLLCHKKVKLNGVWIFIAIVAFCSITAFILSIFDIHVNISFLTYAVDLLRNARTSGIIPLSTKLLAITAICAACTIVIFTIADAKALQKKQEEE